MTDFAGQHVVVWGLGRHGGGVAVVNYLQRLGADITVVDRATEEELTSSLDDVASRETVTWRLGEPGLPIGPDTADWLVVNPAITPDHPDLAQWPVEKRTSELALVADALQTGGHHVIAITGSNGKSTTCLWVACLLQRLQPTRAVRLGGNFELGLTAECQTHLLDQCPLPEPTTVVLEVSSFQLTHLHDAPFTPDVAAITNLTPNHLDWHGSFEDYAAAKHSLLERARIAVPPTTSETSPEGNALRDLVRHVVEALGHVVNEADLDATRPTLRHRLELVAQIDGVTFIDDSAATTPESVGVCLRMYGHETRSRLVVIAGGRNKGFDLDTFARHLACQTYAVATIGETASELAKRVAIHGGKVRSHRSLAKAVKWATKIAPADGVVALSPGMASTDMFVDYKERGDQFRRMLPKSSGEIGGNPGDNAS